VLATAYPIFGRILIVIYHKKTKSVQI